MPLMPPVIPLNPCSDASSAPSSQVRVRTQPRVEFTGFEEGHFQTTSAESYTAPPPVPRYRKQRAPLPRSLPFEATSTSRDEFTAKETNARPPWNSRRVHCPAPAPMQLPFEGTLRVAVCLDGAWGAPLSPSFLFCWGEVG